MSDDEIQLPKKQKIVHYGTLEESMRQATAGASTSVTVTLSGPNINTHNRYYDIQANGQTVERQNQLEAFEMRRKAKQIAVSTDDIEVRAHLRNLNHPMCMYNEIKVAIFLKLMFGFVNQNLRSLW